MSSEAHNLFILRIIRKSLKVIEIDNIYATLLKSILKYCRNNVNNGIKQNEYIIFLF